MTKIYLPELAGDPLGPVFPPGFKPRLCILSSETGGRLLSRADPARIKLDLFAY